MEKLEIEITEKQDDVSYEVPQVRFPAYEEYKGKARTVAEYIDGMDVSEENVKDVKAVLARARKLTDRLSDIRIGMKKDILSNYQAFEAQVKEICGIVAESEQALRVKVRILDDMEREAKKEAIREIWRKRTPVYPELEKLVPDAFERWLEPRHLNKSTSMKSVETDMAGWLRKVAGDMETAKGMGTGYLEAFIVTLDLAKAVQAEKSRAENLRNIEEAYDDEPPEESAVFTVYGRKDILLAERLLEENDINFYERKE